MDESSAKILILEFLTASTMSLIKIMKRRGPSTVPCGTPLITRTGLDLDPITRTT